MREKLQGLTKAEQVRGGGGGGGGGMYPMTFTLYISHQTPVFRNASPHLVAFYPLSGR